MGDKQKPGTSSQVMRGLTHASIGLEMGLSVFIGYLVGAWLDKRFGTSWLTLTFLLVGVVAGFRALFRLAKKVSDEAKAESDPDHQSDGDPP